MKRFFITLLILAVLGGAGFFAGWAQFAVPPGSWGLMRSKTHGLDKDLLREGEFRWVWYKLIPTNVKITVFSPVHVSRSLSWEGELPSGSVYAALAGVSADFSWAAKADLSFSIRPSSLPALAEERGIGSQEELDAYAGELADEIEAFALTLLQSSAETGENLPGPGGGGFQGKLEEEIAAAFPGIENLSCPLILTRFPDAALYQAVRQVFADYLDREREFLAADLSRGTELRLNARTRFNELEKYGELLTRYPILLRYLALESGEASAGDD